MNERSTTFHERIYRRYAQDVYRFAHWLSGNPDDARDITSETFIRAWTSPNEPRMDSVKAYLFTIARNLHRKQWRRASRLETLDEGMPDPAISPAEVAANRDDSNRAFAAMRALPEIDRTVLMLRAEDGLSYEDISAVTGLSVTAAKVKSLFAARAKLFAALLQTENRRKIMNITKDVINDLYPPLRLKRNAAPTRRRSWRNICAPTRNMPRNCASDPARASAAGAAAGAGSRGGKSVAGSPAPCARSFIGNGPRHFLFARAILLHD